MQNFGRENFDDSTCIRQISSDFSTIKVLRYTVVIYTHITLSCLYKYRDFSRGKAVFCPLEIILPPSSRASDELALS